MNSFLWFRELCFSGLGLPTRKLSSCDFDRTKSSLPPPFSNIVALKVTAMQRNCTRRRSVGELKMQRDHPHPSVIF